MAYYKNSNVGQVQTALNGLGNSLAVDNTFGPKTLKAAISAIGGSGSTVKDLQKSLNKGGAGLTEDGIIGPKTVSALLSAINKLGSSSSTSGSTTTAPKTFEQMSTSEKVTYLENNNVEKPQALIDLENNKPGEYKPSDAVNQALKELEDFRATKPGEYVSRYDPQIQGLLDQINNREPFSYDFTKDPMYQQYKDEYTNNAKMAMMDTMGEAAALTGGYGSSYASTVGQQAYQNQMRQLSTDIIPELWNMSYQVYKDNEQSLYNQLAAFQTQDAAEYQRYADKLDAWYNDLNFLYNKWGKMSDDDYQYYVNNLAQWNEDRNYLYGQWRDDQSQHQTELDYWNNKAMQEAALAAASSGGSGSGGSGRGKGKGKDTNNPTGGYTLDPQNVASQDDGSYVETVTGTALTYANQGKANWRDYVYKQRDRGNITSAQAQAIIQTVNKEKKK